MNLAPILVVDDEPSVLNLASLVIQGSGYPVLTSTNGREGLDLFRNSGEPISVLVTDVQMPIMDGIEMAKSIKSENQDVKIIFVSGFAPTKEIADLILEWDAQFLSKPFDLQHLRTAVQRAVSSL
ncbi:MAG TPA: response regulator [Fibrobacteria bacterium]|nr:response regulator [Fibrobacteria bacterium]